MTTTPRPMTFDRFLRLLDLRVGTLERRDNTSGAVIAAVSGIYRPEDYGAVGDGVTDDAAGIQAAINAAQAAGGGIVRLGAKIYGWTGEIVVRDGVWLEGLANSENTANGLKALSATATLSVGKWGQWHRPGGLLRLRVDGNGTGDPNGLIRFQSVYAQMQWVYVTNGAGHNVILDAAQNGIINGLFSTLAGAAALAFTNGAGGWNLIGCHLTSSPHCLYVFDPDSGTGNAYPFGSAHVNFYGGILESYVNGTALADFRCGSLFNFYGTGFSVNNVTMSGGHAIRVGNDDFPSVSTFVAFHGCNFNGGSNLYPAIRIVGNNVVTFTGETYYQNTTDFLLLDSGIPTVKEYGCFVTGAGVTNFMSFTGGASSSNVFSPRKTLFDWRLGSVLPNALSVRRDTDGNTGLRWYMDRDGSMQWNDGTDFTGNVSLSYNASLNTLDLSAVQFTGRVVSEIAIQTITTAGASVTLNSQSSPVHQIILSGVGTVGTMTISNAVHGAELEVWISQPAGGGATYAWATNMRFENNTAPADTTAGTTTIVRFRYYAGAVNKWHETGRTIAVPYT